MNKLYFVYEYNWISIEVILIKYLCFYIFMSTHFLSGTLILYYLYSV